MKKGFTTEQAKLKAVWDNPNIAAICSEMPNMTILQANAAAAIHDAPLSRKDRQLLDQYAGITASGYCSGCARLCESTLGGSVPISDVMRYLMYYDLYGNHDRAVRCFSEIPADTRGRLAGLDFSNAEAVCPQNIPITRLMESAVTKLTRHEPA